MILSKHHWARDAQARPDLFLPRYFYRSPLPSDPGLYGQCNVSARSSVFMLQFLAFVRVAELRIVKVPRSYSRFEQKLLSRKDSRRGNGRRVSCKETRSVTLYSSRQKRMSN